MILEKLKQDETLPFLGKRPTPFLKAGGGTMGLHMLFRAACRLKATRERVRTPKASRKPASRLAWIFARSAFGVRCVLASLFGVPSSPSRTSAVHKALMKGGASRRSGQGLVEL